MEPLKQGLSLLIAAEFMQLTGKDIKPSATKASSGQYM
jgi:hypothetical protein